MRLKSILTGCAIFFALAAGNVKADSACSLFVGYSYYNYGLPFVPGESFSYNIDIRRQLYPGPHPPNVSFSDFTIVFNGTKDGVIDTPPWGEHYPGIYALGFYNMGGFYNPGGIAGTYERYAEVRWPNGGIYCITNTVTVVLL